MMPQVTPVLGAACPAVVGDGARDGTKGRTQNRSVQLPPDEDAYTCCPSAYGYRMLMGEFSQPEGGFTERLRDGFDFGARRARSMPPPSLTIVRAGRLELPRVLADTRTQTCIRPSEPLGAVCLVVPRQGSAAP